MPLETFDGLVLWEDLLTWIERIIYEIIYCLVPDMLRPLKFSSLCFRFLLTWLIIEIPALANRRPKSSQW